ncbi:galanin receptor type 1-like [Stylophora pistillata]|uniref:galanin receptor type 1-like n=1 Tax=Stylophora pistillata TaxID=50429 RepID=UPI000C03A0DE|nr:galanin receptor type 1-like [Stylophora pistillata]
MTNNSTTDVTSATMTYFGAEPILQLTLTSFIALVGMLGNILTCVTLMSKHQPFKSPIKQYLISLAVADMGILTIAYPMVIIRSEISWPFGEYVCRIIFPLSDVFFGASVWAVTAVSMERWRRISATQTVPTMSTSRCAMKVVAAIWIASFLVTSTPFYIMIEFIDTGNGKLCLYHWGKYDKFHEVYSIVLFLFWFGVPMGVILWNYIVLRGKLKESTTFIVYYYKSVDRESTSSFTATSRQTFSSLSSTSNAPVCRRLKENKQAQRVLTPVVIVFAITMLPLNLLYLTLAYWPSFAQMPFFHSLAYLCILLVVVNSSCNPIIYEMVSRNFRNSLRAVLEGTCRKPSFSSERVSFEREQVV